MLIALSLYAGYCLGCIFTIMICLRGQSLPPEDDQDTDGMGLLTFRDLGDGQ